MICTQTNSVNPLFELLCCKAMCVVLAANAAAAAAAAAAAGLRYNTGWRGGLVVGRRTCDLRVAGSRPGRDAAAQQP